MRNSKIAHIAHEVNRAYCASIGDTSQPAWDDAPDWQKESAIKGVEYALEHPESTPETQHESWYQDKRDAGWKYGEVKNPDRKEHPAFMPYANLPPEQKVKDFLFLAVVRTCDIL